MTFNSSTDFSLIVLFLLSVLFIPQVCLHTIRYLYNSQPDILSYPERINRLAHFRSISFHVLCWIIFGLMIFCTPDTSLPITILHILFSALMLMIVFTDIEQEVIFDKVNLFLGCCGLGYIFLADLPLMHHLLTGIGTGILFLILAILGRGAIGGGDIKLMTALGIWLGYNGILQTIIIGSILGGTAAFILLITKRLKRKDSFAYGAYYAIAALISFFLMLFN